MEKQEEVKFYLLVGVYIFLDILLFVDMAVYILVVNIIFNLDEVIICG